MIILVIFMVLFFLLAFYAESKLCLFLGGLFGVFFCLAQFISGIH